MSELKYLSMCMVHCNGRSIDLGNYYSMEGKKVLVTSKELAKKYGDLVECPIYTRKGGDEG